MPRTQTITRTVYQFDELSDAAKDKARDWYRSCQDSNDFDSVIEDFQEVAAVIGISFDTHEVRLMSGKTRQEPNIYWSGFCQQGDGACFEGEYRFAGDSCEKIRAYCSDTELLRITDELNRIQSARILLGRPTLNAEIKKRSHHYSHENTVEVDVVPSEEPQNDEEDVQDVEVDTVAELMRDLMRWLYKRLDEQNDYLNSDEYIDDSITANEYEFDEEGAQI